MTSIRPLPLSAAIGMALVLMCALPSVARANCSPSSPPDGSTVTCSGGTLLGNPYATNANNLTVNVQPGAQVTSLLGIGTALQLSGAGNTLNNSGTVDPSLLGALSLLSEGTQIGNGNANTGFTLNNYGTLKGTSSLITVNLGGGALGGLALDGRTGAGGVATIYNSGTMGSTPLLGVSLLAPDAPVVAIQGTGSVNFTNDTTGTITGRMSFEGAGNTMTNKGILTGSLYMGAGNNTFNAYTGSVVSSGGGLGVRAQIGDLLGLGLLTYAQTGVVDGGAGTNNTLTLNGTGTDTASSGTYIDFQHLAVNSGTWHLRGVLGSTDTTLNGGTALVQTGTDLGGALIGNGGTLSAENNAVTVSAPVTLNAGGLTVTGDTQPLTLSGIVGGPGGLTKSGAAELDLTGANTYQGGTTLQAGTLGAGSNSALGSGTLNVTGNSNLSPLASNVTLANAVTLANGATLTITGANNLALNGAVSGAGALTMNSPGVLALQGGNTYQGGTTLNAGTVQVAGANALGTGVLNANGGALVANTTASLANNVTLTVPATSVQTNADLTLSGVLNGSGGFIKTGAGNLILTGANAYSGLTTLSGGTLTLGQLGSLGTGGLEVAASSTLANTGTPWALPDAITLDTGSTLTVNAPGATLAGVVSGAGGLSVNQTLTLGNANTYQGGTTLQPGAVVTLGNAQALGTGAVQSPGAASIASTGNFSVNNGVVTGGALSLQPASGTQLSWTGPITGTGSVVMSGAGVLDLAGLNAYQGGTTVKSGTLLIGNANSLGTGGLTMQGGALHVPAAMLLSLPVTLAADTPIITDAPVSLSGALSGTGSLQKQGTGTLSLLGNLSAYQGLLNAQAGTLSVLSPFTGAGTAQAGATLEFGAGSAGSQVSLAAPMAGNLTLNTGQVALTVPVANFGNLTGTVAAHGTQDTLEVTGTGDGAWAPGTLSNLTQITVDSGAQVALAASQSRLTDAYSTVVNGGLRVDGTLGNQVTVGSTGTLVGTGTVTGDLVLNGTLAPGGIAGSASTVLAPTTTAAGNFTVGGNFTSQAGANYVVRTWPDGTNDHLQVNGSATLNGGQVIAMPQQTAYGLSTTYSILDATNGVTGTFSGVTQTTLPFLTASLSTTANNVNLILTRNDQGGGGTGTGGTGTGGTGTGGTGTGGTGTGGTGTGGTGTGGTGTGGTGTGGTGTGGTGTGGTGTGGTGTGGSGTGGTGTGGTVTSDPPGDPSGSTPTLAYNAFPGLTRNEQAMAATLQRVENQEIASGQTSALEPLLARVRGLSYGQVKAAFNSLTGETQASLPQLGLDAARQRTNVVLDSATFQLPATMLPNDPNAWVSPYGSNMDLDGHQGNANLSSRQRGLAAGIDHDFNEHTALGVFLTSDRSNFNDDQRGDKGHITQTGLGLRALHVQDHFYIKGLVEYSHLSSDVDRRVSLPGFDGTAHSSPSGSVWQAGVEAGWPFALGHGLTLAPVVGGYYTHLSLDSRQEQNAGLADLNVGRQSQSQTLATAGVKLAQNLNNTWSWEGTLRGVHNFNAGDPKAQMAFAAVPGQTFDIIGNGAGHQWAEADLGVRYAFADRWTVGAHYTQAFGGNQKAKAVNVALSVHW